MDKGRGRILWSDRALRDLEGIFAFNALVQGSEKSSRLVGNIVNFIKRRLGGRIDGGMPDLILNRYLKNIRKVIFGNYRISYINIGERRLILRIFDTRRDPSKNL